MRSISCAVCGRFMGYTRAIHVPVLYCDAPCADRELDGHGHNERDDLIELLARDFDLGSTEIVLILDQCGWKLSRQWVHQIVRERLKKGATKDG